MALGRHRLKISKIVLERQNQAESKALSSKTSERVKNYELKNGA